LGCQERKQIDVIATRRSIATTTLERSSQSDLIALRSSSNPFESIEYDPAKDSSPRESIPAAEKKSLDTSIPTKRLYILSSPSEMRQDMPPNQTSTVTRVLGPNQLIRAMGSREHTEVRALGPERSTSSCLSLSLIYSLYNTTTGRRKKVFVNTIFLNLG